MTFPAMIAPTTVQSAFLLDGVQLLFRTGGGPVPVDSNGCEWILTKLDGWAGVPKPRTTRVIKPFGLGAFRSRSYLGPRIISVEFVVGAPDPSTLRLVEQRLGAWCSDGGRLYTLQVSDPPIQPLTSLVELDDQIMTVPRTPMAFMCSAHFAAPDPRKWDAQWQDRTSQFPVPSTAPGINFTAPGADYTAPGLDYGPGPTLSTSRVGNYGTASVGPFFRVTGPVAQPRVTDLVSGWLMTYTGTLLTGDVLTINCDDFPQRGQGSHTCLLNGVTNVWSQVVRSGDWPSIDPQGTASYQLTSTVQGQTGGVLVVSVRSAWF